MVEEVVKGTKERSALYPAVALNECIEFIELVNKLGGRKVALTSIADAVGVSTTTYSFKAKISSSKQFGLIKSAGGAVELSDTAKRLLYPTDDISTKELLLQCLMTAPLYRKLIERYDDQAVPTEERLGNILLQEYSITRSAKDIAAKKFLASVEHAGILQNGVLILNPNSDEGDGERQDVVPKDQTASNIDSGNEKQYAVATQAKGLQTEGYHFAIPTLSGATAQVTIPKEITAKDLDYILLYIQSMLPAFIENLKDEL